MMLQQVIFISIMFIHILKFQSVYKCFIIDYGCESAKIQVTLLKNTIVMEFLCNTFHLGIDYALEYTKQDSVYYAGHSMGTTQYVVMLSQRPEYNNKVRIPFYFCNKYFVNN